MTERPQPFAASVSTRGFCTEKGRCRVAKRGDCEPGTGRENLAGHAAAQTMEVARRFAEQDLFRDVQAAEAEQQEFLPTDDKHTPLKCNIQIDPRSKKERITNTETGDVYATNWRGELVRIHTGGGGTFPSEK